MKKVVALSFVLAALSAFAELVVPLSADGIASATVYLPKGASGPVPAVVVCPGGGYKMLCDSYEGHDMARWLNVRGIAGIVLRYHLAPKFHKEEMLADGYAALKLVRDRAAEWKIDPKRVGALGFSAGGHLASMLGVLPHAQRADFMALVYPHTSMRHGLGHEHMRKAFLGPDYTDADVEKYSAEAQVTADTPPAFVVHARTDQVCDIAFSRTFVDAMRKAGRPVSYTELPKGAHGLGAGKGEDWAAWLAAFDAWLKESKLSSGAEYPFIVFRLTSSPLRKPDFFTAACAVHAKYRGAFDEFWFGGGKPLCKVEFARARLAEFEKLRPAVEAAGLRVSFQQGLTTGHDYKYIGTPGTQAAAGVYAAEEVEPFPDDAWMVRPNGEVAKGKCLCARSPAVRDYEYRYAKTVMETLRPETYWLDDDLRLGVGKVGCFCPRCLAAFNERVKGNFTREALVKRLFEGAELDPVRFEWIRFNEQTLALYGAAARRAADEVQPGCRLALQTVSADCLLNGRDYGPVLTTLSGNGRVLSGLRPGHGCYKEDRPLDFLQKALWCTREAERSRKLNMFCGTICYEEETYTRRVLHKSPRTIVTECALALASGCDTLSLYWADGERPERIEDYERFVKTVASARPYFEKLAASTKRTSLGGVARYLGSRAYEQKGCSLGDDSDLALMRSGIPVTVAEATAAHKVWRLTPKSLAAMTPEETAKLRAEGALELPVDPTPRVSERQAWLDAIDRATNGRFPVRVDFVHALRVLPRVDTAGKTDSVTLLNLSIGDTDEFPVRIRNPRGRHAVLATPRGEQSVPGVYDAAKDELVVTVPNLGGWQVCTLFL